MSPHASAQSRAQNCMCIDCAVVTPPQCKAHTKLKPVTLQEHPSTHTHTCAHTYNTQAHTHNTHKHRHTHACMHTCTTGPCLLMVTLGALWVFLFSLLFQTVPNGSGRTATNNDDKHMSAAGHSKTKCHCRLGGCVPGGCVMHVPGGGECCSSSIPLL